ncbi:MAG TPA: Rrf2 family transcriptional regulator [Thermodesulfovibrionales bacterium]|jgi:Rrf2 family protein|nr:Rrf2 family transcriptional regulator [Thermodesulfovibrionales bacterium]
MNITRETDYAVRCVLYLSMNPQTVTVVEDIAREMEIPKSFLAKILQKLVKAGIVKSSRGVKGGFRLGGEPSEVNLLTVIEAIQGPLCLNICVLDSDSCSRSSFCSVHPVWVEIQRGIENKLRHYTFGRFSKEETTTRNRRSETS